MFQNVRNTRLVRRVGLEPDREDIVLIISGKMKAFGSGPIVLKLQGCELQLWHMLHTLEGKSMQIRPRFG